MKQKYMTKLIRVVKHEAIGALSELDRVFVSYPGEAAISYSYDPAGNRVSATEGGETTTFEYDDANQLTNCDTEEVDGTSFDHDANGNLIEKDDGVVVTGYEWNDKNGLIGMTVDESTVWQATYYPNGTRESKTNTDGSILYLYDGKKPIGTYETDWTRRESFGYGFGSNDPMLNVQYDGGESAYYYFKDGLGNVNLIMNAGGTTEATVGLNACGVPAGDTGGFRSDVDFAGGGWAYDDDIGAYINYTDTETGKYLGARIFYDEECGACLTEIGLPPWEKPEEPEEPGGGGEESWPPLVDPFGGRFPAMLDAGDAGLGGEDTEGNLSHHNGIDWVSEVGAEALAVATGTYSSGLTPNDTSWPRFELEETYSYKDSPYKDYLDDSNNMPSWRNKGGVDHVNSVAYAHHNGLDGFVSGVTVVNQGEVAAVTNRKRHDGNLGPHLHLWMTGNGGDAKWQERYFPPMEEIPLAMYLMAVCRYGWTEGTFGDYTWDWAAARDGGNGLGLGGGCMAYNTFTYKDKNDKDQTFKATLGMCAQACHSVAAVISEQDCQSTIRTSPEFFDEYSFYGQGTSAWLHK